MQYFLVERTQVQVPVVNGPGRPVDSPEIYTETIFKIIRDVFKPAGHLVAVQVEVILVPSITVPVAGHHIHSHNFQILLDIDYLLQFNFQLFTTVLVKRTYQKGQVRIIVPIFIGPQCIDAPSVIFIFIIILGWSQKGQVSRKEVPVEVTVIIVKPRLYKFFIYVLSIQIDPVKIIVDI